MGLFEKLFGTKENSLSSEEILETGVCPNCWGKQEYEGEFRAFVDDATKSNINHDKQQQKAFVSQFVETHVTGIKLKKDGEHLICPTCYAKY